MAYKGKQFEEDFKASVAPTDADINRIYDQTSGRAGVKTMCDFIVYRHPNIFYLELKAHEGNRLPFTAITEFQIKGLHKKTIYKGSNAGILCHYTDHKKTIFIPIRVIAQMIDLGGKSIHIDEAIIYGVEISGKRKRTRWDFDFNEHTWEAIAKKCVEVW